MPVRLCLIYLLAALAAGFILGWAIFHTKSTVPTDDAAGEQIEIVTVDVPQPEAQSAPAETQPVQAVPEPKAEEPKEQPDEQPASASKSDVVTSASIAYLDNNKTWSREGLEKQPGLSGLFDDMNNYRFDRIINYWGPRLEKSSRFKNVVKFVRQGSSKKIFKPSGTFCKSNQSSINVQTYVNTVDPAVKKKK